MRNANLFSHRQKPPPNAALVPIRATSPPALTHSRRRFRRLGPPFKRPYAGITVTFMTHSISMARPINVSSSSSRKLSITLPRATRTPSSGARVIRFGRTFVFTYCFSHSFNCRVHVLVLHTGPADMVELAVNPRTTGCHGRGGGYEEGG